MFTCCRRRSRDWEEVAEDGSKRQMTHPTATSVAVVCDGSGGVSGETCGGEVWRNKIRGAEGRVLLSGIARLRTRKSEGKDKGLQRDSTRVVVVVVQWR